MWLGHGFLGPWLLTEDRLAEVSVPRASTHVRITSFVTLKANWTSRDRAKRNEDAANTERRFVGFITEMKPFVIRDMFYYNRNYLGAFLQLGEINA